MLERIIKTLFVKYESIKNPERILKTALDFTFSETYRVSFLNCKMRRGNW